MRRSERLTFEAAVREAERLRDHLRFIASRTRGMAPALASSALHSNTWPTWPRSKKQHT
jgi:hypothetical protein